MQKVEIEGLKQNVEVLHKSLDDYGTIGQEMAKTVQQMGKGVMEVTTSLQREVASLQQQLNSLKPKAPETK